VGDLVSAEAGLLVDDELLDAEGFCDAFVGGLNLGDGGVGGANLPRENARAEEKRGDRHDDHFAEDVVEARCVHGSAGSSCLKM